MVRLVFLVLTWISVYWFSRAGPAASVRIYYEYAQDGGIANLPVPKIPMGVSYLPQEIINLPRAFVYQFLFFYFGHL